MTLAAGIVLALAGIGALRVLRVTYLACRGSVRALGRGLAAIGKRLASEAPREPRANRKRASEDVDPAVVAAVVAALQASKEGTRKEVDN